MLAFTAVPAEVRTRLIFRDCLGKRKPLQNALRELHPVIRGAEVYVRHCLQPRDSWWARTTALTLGADYGRRRGRAPGRRLQIGGHRPE